MELLNFEAVLEIIGINPYVSVPEPVLRSLFDRNGKDKGPIPVHGTINEKPYRQTLVRYRGAWRLYINTSMLPKSPERIGEILRITIAYDSSDRSVHPPPKLLEALANHPEAQRRFSMLTPSRRKEISRYIASLKTEESVQRNVERAIRSLLGKEPFAGRNDG